MSYRILILNTYKFFKNFKKIQQEEQNEIYEFNKQRYFFSIFKNQKFNKKREENTLTIILTKNLISLKNNFLSKKFHLNRKLQTLQMPQIYRIVK